MRIGVVGAGSIVRSRHVPGFAKLSGVRLEAVANTTEESSRRAAEEFGFARTHRHWRDLVADPDIDAVVIGTWPYLHEPIFLAALDDGKHVLTQARLAMNAAEGRTMLAAALRRPDLVSMVVPSPFSLWADACVRRLLTSGELGELRLVRAFWGGGNGGLEPGPAWRLDRRYSGNNVLSLGILYEGMARWVGHTTWVQAAEQNVAGAGSTHSATPGIPADVPDLLSVIGELPGGARLSLDMSPHARFGESNGVWLYGSAGSLFVDLAGQVLTLRREGEQAAAEVTPAAGERGDWRVEAEFVGAIRGEEQVRLTDVATAVRYMEFTDAVRLSAATGHRVSLAEV
ncbi:Gfo/Idh/MocA family oxidoreductase [Flindersiella endophytica]